MMIKKLAIVVSVIGLLSLGAVFIYGASKGQLNSDFEIIIKADQNTVWGNFQNPGKFKKWMSGFEKIEMIEGIPGTEGSTYALHFINEDGSSNVLNQKLTSIDAPNSISFDLNNEMFSSTLLITLQEVNDGTKMSVTMSTEGSNPFYNAFIHLGKEKIDQNQRQNYEAFKQLLEQE
ncbi:MAG: SRPBCC family protein [Flavobacteriales bacterium]|nr:SRPBCC family protein [Flavobacteriales bacterium]